MKRIIPLLLSLLLICSAFVGCGNTAEAPVEKPEAAVATPEPTPVEKALNLEEPTETLTEGQTLTDGETYQVTFLSTASYHTNDNMRPSEGGGWSAFLIWDDVIDFCFDLTNMTNDTVYANGYDYSQLANFRIRMIDDKFGNEYTADMTIMESLNHKDFETELYLNPGETVRVHFFLSPVSSMPSATIFANCEGTEYFLQHYSKDGDPAPVEMTLAEAQAVDGIGSITADEWMTNTELIPAGAEGAYTYYAAKDGNQYVIAALTVENSGDADARIGDLLTAAWKADATSYPAALLIDADGAFTENGTVAAGESATVYAVTEVPADLAPEAAAWNFTFGGAVYTLPAAL